MDVDASLVARKENEMGFSRRALLKAAGASTWLGAARTFAAETYPSHTVTMVVPFSPGGATDSTVRIIAEHFRGLTGQPMLVENRPGGGSMVALNHLKQRKPDGYTLGIMSRGQFVTYWMQNAGAGLDPLGDFTFICATHGSIFGLLARADAPWRSLKDLVSDAKARSAPLTVGAIGAGSVHHLVALEFARLAGIQIVHIPFKGEAESNSALLGGQIDLAVSSGSFIPFVHGGKLRVLAVAERNRLARYAEWPTFAEQGYAVVVHNTVGIGGPKGMAPQTVAAIDGIFQRLMQAPDLVASLAQIYQSPSYLGTDAYVQLMRNEFVDARRLVDQYKLKQGAT